MSEEFPSDASTHKTSLLLLIVTVATWVVPIVLWMIHILIIVPILNTLSGDAKFVTAMQFFMLSGVLMIVCLLASVIIFLRQPSLFKSLPIVLNLSWIYYVKVLFYGPTIGNM